MKKIRALRNNEIVSTPFDFNFSKKITTLAHVNQTCAYSKQRVQGWWRELCMTSRQSARQSNSCSFLFSLVHDFFKPFKRLNSLQRGLSQFSCNVRIFTICRTRMNRRVELEIQNGATAKFTQSRAWFIRAQ